MTHLIASIHVTTVSGARHCADQAMRLGANAIELRVDGFRGSLDELCQWLADFPNQTWIVTCRSRSEGGRSDESPDQRALLVSQIVCGTHACVDFEFADWISHPTAQDTIRQAIASPTGSSRLILSAHNFEEPFAHPESLVEEMLQEPLARCAKIAYRSRTAAESLAALDVMRRYGNRTCAIAMGPCGTWTRVVAPKCDAWGTYAALDPEQTTAPGQFTVQEMIERFRWQRIGPETRLFGVIGDPVEHSMSPLVFNSWFGTNDEDGVYVPILVPGGGAELSSFLDGLAARTWLDVRGMSVTIPHKRSALDWCGGGADSMARSIGAANTIVFGQDRARVFNTDCYAAVDSLCAALELQRHEIREIRVDVLGAGGVAQAMVYALQECGCRGTIYARNLDRAKVLAQEFNFDAAPWHQRTGRSGDVVINATSVGMWPDIDQTPLPAAALAGCMLAFDAIYNPIETRFLAKARNQGIATLNGLDMFVRQAAMQYELWTGRRPDSQHAALLVSEELRQGPRPKTADSHPSAQVGGTNAAMGSQARASRGTSIVLIGLRGSGKSTVGRLLADRLGFGYVDTDERIVSQVGQSIAEIFANCGESGFRTLERMAIETFTPTLDSPQVISVGGGAILDADNVRRLQAAGTLVWLKTSPQELHDRITSDKQSPHARPPLTALDSLDEIQQIAKERTPIYQRIADLTIETTGKRPEQIVAEIISKLDTLG